MMNGTVKDGGAPRARQRNIQIVAILVAIIGLFILVRDSSITSPFRVTDTSTTTGNRSTRGKQSAAESAVAPRLLDKNNRTLFDTTILRNRAASLRRQAQEIRANPINATNKIHIFSYASESWNLTMERLVLEAQRSELFETVQPFTRATFDQIDPEFTSVFREILSMPRGGGYWLWKFPLLEHMLLQRAQLGDYVFYLDAGSSVLSTSSKGILSGWLNSLEQSKKEMVRFFYKQGRRCEMDWCVAPLFHAFNLTCSNNDKPNHWKGCLESQMPAGGMIFQNGAATREMLALIYDALAHDPWIITDVYNLETKAQQGSGFNENRHDQCLFNVATKQVDSFITYPAPKVDLYMKRHKVFQFSRVSGPRSGQPEMELDPKTFAYWKKKCFPRNMSNDYFCDEVSLNLHRDDLSSGRLEFRLTNIWNESIDDVNNVETN